MTDQTDAARALLDDPVHEWCICRWHKRSPDTDELHFCGPLGFDYSRTNCAGFGPLGFPQRGGICVHLFTYPSREDLERDIENQSCPTTVVDRVTRVGDLHFSTVLLSHYDGSRMTVYGGGDFAEARRAYWEVLGRIQALVSGGNYLHVTIECEPRDGVRHLEELNV